MRSPRPGGPASRSSPPTGGPSPSGFARTEAAGSSTPPIRTPPTTDCSRCPRTTPRGTPHGTRSPAWSPGPSRKWVPNTRPSTSVCSRAGAGLRLRDDGARTTRGWPSWCPGRLAGSPHRRMSGCCAERRTPGSPRASRSTAGASARSSPATRRQRFSSSGPRSNRDRSKPSWTTRAADRCRSSPRWTMTSSRASTIPSTSRFCRGSGACSPARTESS